MEKKFNYIYKINKTYATFFINIYYISGFVLKFIFNGQNNHQNLLNVL